MVGTDIIEREEVETGSALALIEPMSVGLARAEIDVQIATARRYPRSIERASKNILSLVTLDTDMAGECIYALPRGGKPVQGASIRLAEIVFQCWGNARSDASVTHVDRVEKVVIAEGTYHDLETNSASRTKVRRSIAGKNGKIFSDDMIIMAGNAACSIAKRNAILAGVPKTVWGRAYKQALEVVAGTLKTLSVTRDNAIAAFAHFGVKPEQIFPAIGVSGLQDIKLDHIPVLRGMYSALKNGEATVEEMFDPRKTTSNHEKVANPLSDTPPHDPETGEITPTAALASPASADPAKPAQTSTPAAEAADASPEAEETPRETLLAEIREEILAGGRKLLTILNALGDRRGLLTDEDVRLLKEFEKKAGAK